MTYDPVATIARELSLSEQAVTAVARELLGFIWAIGVEVEQQEGRRPVRVRRAAA